MPDNTKPNYTKYDPRSPQSYEDYYNTVKNHLKYSSLTPVDNPKVIFIGGQPGAGKSNIAKLAESECAGNVVKIDPDEIRELHPRAQAIKEIEGEGQFFEYTKKIVDDIIKILVEEAKKDRLNVKVKSPLCKKSNDRKMANFREAGYQVEAKVVVTNERNSILGIHERYEVGRAKTSYGRLVSLKRHQDYYDNFPGAIEHFEKGKHLDKIELYRPSIGEAPPKLIYQNELDVNGDFKQLPAAREALEKERIREPQPEETNNYYEMWQKTIAFMEHREAGQEEIDAIKNIAIKYAYDPQDAASKLALNRGTASELKYIHQNTEWPNFQYDLNALAGPLEQVKQRQKLFLEKMGQLGFEYRTEANVETMVSELVKSSAIEGEIINPSSVRSSLARRLGLDTAGVQEPIDRQIDGLVDMILDATQKFSSPLTKERLCGWHATLFPSGFSGMHKINVGDWRQPSSGAMQIVSGAMGREKVHYEAPAPEKVPGEMEKFLNWVNSSEPIDPILKAGIANYWYVAIHPFEDGNGRIGRAIADHLLARSDNSPERFYSLSNQIEKESNDYYDILEKTSNGKLDITPWASWFIGCVDRSIISSEQSLETVINKANFWQKAKKHDLNDRQKNIFSKLLEGFKGNLTVKKYAKITKCSEEQATSDLEKLEGTGLIIKAQSEGQSPHYLINNKAFAGKPEDTPPLHLKN